MGSSEPEVLAAAALVAAFAGVIRGITGFGGAMVMAPPFALLLGPLLAVPVVLLLEGIAATPMLVQLRRAVSWRTLGPIVAAAYLTMPLGVWMLVTAEPQLMRRAIAMVVIVFSLLMLLGWRHSGSQRLGTSLGLGAVSGAMAGATTLGGPPVILYLLAGPDPIETTRANLTYYLGALCLAGLALLGWNGVLGRDALLLSAALTPGYCVGMFAGIRLFSRFNDQRFRQFTLALMLVVATGILIA